MNIIFYCVASPDYITKYQLCIDSQKTYCQKNNYSYLLDDKISENYYWKKIEGVKQFYNTYDIVVIIDADCEITNKCPPLETIINESSIYYVLGISGRPNSGFLPIRTNSRGKEFITDIISKKEKECPRKYVMKGENGVVIWSLDENNISTKELPLMWNCSNPENIDTAYIIHYTNLMRNKYTYILREK
jgi:hypothetical protein